MNKLNYEMYADLHKDVERVLTYRMPHILNIYDSSELENSSFTFSVFTSNLIKLSFSNHTLFIDKELITCTYEELLERIN